MKKLWLKIDNSFINLDNVDIITVTSDRIGITKNSNITVVKTFTDPNDSELSKAMLKKALLMNDNVILNEI